MNKCLIIIEKDLGELNDEQIDILTKMTKSFNIILKHNRDIEEILDCDNCGWCETE